MSKSFAVLIGDVSKGMATLRKTIPETMKGFGATWPKAQWQQARFLRWKRN